jgi:hypothetical protein
MRLIASVLIICVTLLSMKWYGARLRASWRLILALKCAAGSVETPLDDAVPVFGRYLSGQ